MQVLGLIIILISISFQFATAIFSLRLIKTTGYVYSWISISVAFILMGIRRTIVLINILTLTKYSFDIESEIVALIISVLLFWGIKRITPMFDSIKSSREKINALLKEKEIILKEVHHRIKNNMNTTYGLIVLQADAVKDPEAKKALDDASNRVQAMITLYEELFISGHYSEVTMKNYLPMLAERIIANFPYRNKVRLKVDSEDIVLDEKKLSSLGLIINELLTNIMKYAFVSRESGEIYVSLKKDANKIVLIIQDNGNGIPETVDIKNSSGFGLSLIDMLTKQLAGSISYKNHNGTKVTLEFNAE